jgi:2-C-methyl-D-erythritol 4-phosphate cytidylyltransferase
VSGPALRGPILLGLVVDTGDDPVLGLHVQGRTLVAHAVEVLGRVPGIHPAVVGSRHRGVTTLAPDQPWRPRTDGGLVLHDPRCPLLPAEAISHCLQALAAADGGTAVIGVRPVTDTLKEVVDGAVVNTIDRDTLAALASPVVVGPGLLDELGRRLPAAGDLADLGTVVEVLTGLGTVLPVQVPSSARRVTDQLDIELLECLHGPGQPPPER